MDEAALARDRIGLPSKEGVNDTAGADGYGQGQTGAAYTLVILTTIATINIVDRQLMSLLAQPVKMEMGLSDSQLGIILGPATGLLFLFLGVPLARLADRTSRKGVIGACLFFFSLATAACGLVTNFIQLMIARICVAAGEAGTLPASQSIISDMFPPDRRTFALSALTSATCLGTFIAFVIGGYLTATFGWRLVFLLLGVPGLLVCAVYMLTTRERVRERATAPAASRSMGKSLAFLWSQRPFRRVCYAYSVYMTGSLTIILWLPAFFARSYGLGPKEIGIIMGLSIGVLGFLGSYLFGWLAQRLARRDFRWNLWSVGLAALCGTPFLWSMLFPSDLSWLLALGVFPALICNFHQAPSIAVIQSLTPPQMRSEASALILTISSVVAASIGPLLAGWISDLMTLRAGDESLRYSLGCVSLAWPLAALLFWWAAQLLPSDRRPDEAAPVEAI
jgi:Arabinose efflux permease